SPELFDRFPVLKGLLPRTDPQYAFATGVNVALIYDSSEELGGILEKNVAALTAIANELGLSPQVLTEQHITLTATTNVGALTTISGAQDVQWTKGTEGALEAIQNDFAYTKTHFFNLNYGLNDDLASVSEDTMALLTDMVETIGLTPETMQAEHISLVASTNLGVQFSLMAQMAAGGVLDYAYGISGTFNMDLDSMNLSDFAAAGQNAMNQFLDVMGLKANEALSRNIAVTLNTDVGITIQNVARAEGGWNTQVIVPVSGDQLSNFAGLDAALKEFASLLGYSVNFRFDNRITMMAATNLGFSVILNAVKGSFEYNENNQLYFKADLQEGNYYDFVNYSFRLADDLSNLTEGERNELYQMMVGALNALGLEQTALDSGVLTFNMTDAHGNTAALVGERIRSENYRSKLSVKGDHYVKEFTGYSYHDRFGLSITLVEANRFGLFDITTRTYLDGGTDELLSVPREHRIRNEVRDTLVDGQWKTIVTQYREQSENGEKFDVYQIVHIEYNDPSHVNLMREASSAFINADFIRIEKGMGAGNELIRQVNGRVELTGKVVEAYAGNYEFGGLNANGQIFVGSSQEIMTMIDSRHVEIVNIAEGQVIGDQVAWYRALSWGEWVAIGVVVVAAVVTTILTFGAAAGFWATVAAGATAVGWGALVATVGFSAIALYEYTRYGGLTPLAEAALNFAAISSWVGLAAGLTSAAVGITEILTNSAVRAASLAARAGIIGASASFMSRAAFALRFVIAPIVSRLSGFVLFAQSILASFATGLSPAFSGTIADRIVSFISFGIGVIGIGQIVFGSIARMGLALWKTSTENLSSIVSRFLNFGENFAKLQLKMSATEYAAKSVLTKVVYSLRAMVFSIRSAIYSSWLSVQLKWQAGLKSMVTGLVETFFKTTAAIKNAYVAFRGTVVFDFLFGSFIKTMSTLEIISGGITAIVGQMVGDDTIRDLGLGIVLLGVGLRFFSGVKLSFDRIKSISLHKVPAVTKYRVYLHEGSKLLNMVLGGYTMLWGYQVSTGSEDLKNLALKLIPLAVATLALRMGPLFFGSPFAGFAMIKGSLPRFLHQLGTAMSWGGFGLTTFSFITGWDQGKQIGIGLILAGFVLRGISGAMISKMIRVQGELSAEAARIVPAADLGSTTGAKFASIIGRLMRGGSQEFWRQAAGSFFWFRAFPVFQAVTGIDHLVDYVLGLFGVESVMTKHWYWNADKGKMELRKVGFWEHLTYMIEENWSPSSLADRGRFLHDITLGQILHVFGITYSARSGLLGRFSEAGGFFKGILKAVNPARYANLFDEPTAGGLVKRILMFADNMIMFNIFMAPAMAFQRVMSSQEETYQEQDYLQLMLTFPVMLLNFVAAPAKILGHTIAGSFEALSQEISSYALFLVPQGRHPFALEKMKEFTTAKVEEFRHAERMTETAYKEIRASIPEADRWLPASDSVRTQARKLYDQAVQDMLAGRAEEAQQKLDQIRNLMPNFDPVQARKTNQEVFADIITRFLTTGEFAYELAADLEAMGYFGRTGKALEGRFEISDTVWKDFSEKALRSMVKNKINVYVSEGKRVTPEAARRELIRRFLNGDIKDLGWAMSRDELKREYDATEHVNRFELDPVFGVNALFIRDVGLALEQTGLLSRAVRGDPLAPKDAISVLALLAEGRLPQEYLNALVREIATQFIREYIATELQRHDDKENGLALSLIMRNIEKYEGRRIIEILKAEGIDPQALPASLHHYVLDMDFRLGAVWYIASGINFKNLKEAILTSDKPLLDPSTRETLNNLELQRKGLQEGLELWRQELEAIEKQKEADLTPEQVEQKNLLLQKVRATENDIRNLNQQINELREPIIEINTMFGRMTIDRFTIELLHATTFRIESLGELFVEKVARELNIDLNQFKSSLEKLQGRVELMKDLKAKRAQLEELQQAPQTNTSEIRKLETAIERVQSLLDRAYEVKVPELEALATQIARVRDQLESYVRGELESTGLFGGPGFRSTIENTLIIKGGVYDLMLQSYTGMVETGFYAYQTVAKAKAELLAAVKASRDLNLRLFNGLKGHQVTQAQARQVLDKIEQLDVEIAELEKSIEEGEVLISAIGGRVAEPIRIGNETLTKSALKSLVSYVLFRQRVMIQDRIDGVVKVATEAIRSRDRVETGQNTRVREALSSPANAYLNRLIIQLGQARTEAERAAVAQELMAFLSKETVGGIFGLEGDLSSAKIGLALEILAQMERHQAVDGNVLGLLEHVVTLCSVCASSVIAEMIRIGNGTLENIIRLGDHLSRYDLNGFESLHSIRAIAEASQKDGGLEILFGTPARRKEFEDRVAQYVWADIVRTGEARSAQDLAVDIVRDMTQIAAFGREFKADREAGRELDLTNPVIRQVMEALLASDFNKAMKAWETDFLQPKSKEQDVTKADFKAFFDLVKKIIAAKYENGGALYYKLFGRAEDGFRVVDPRLQLSELDIAMGWDLALVSFLFTEKTGLWFKQDQRDAYLAIQSKNINLAMGGGKTFVALALAAVHGINVYLTPSRGHVDQIIKDANYQEFFKAFGRELKDAASLIDEIRSGNAEAPARVRELIEYLKNQKGPLLIVDRESLAQLQNLLFTSEDAHLRDLYGEYRDAFAQSARLFDEIHQTANPLYFIVGGHTTTARESLKNYQVLTKVAERADDLLVFDRQDYEAGKVLVTTSETVFKEIKGRDGAVIWVYDGKIKAWSGQSVVRVFENDREVKLAIEQATADGVHPMHAGELFSILKARIINFRDSNDVIKYLLGPGGVRLDKEQYRPFSREHGIETNLIIEDTPWLIGIAAAVRDAVNYLEADRTMEADSKVSRLKILKDNLMRDEGGIEITSTVTAVSMFDLFVTKEGAPRPVGMSGTALGVQTALEVLSGRLTEAIKTAGETGAFLIELFSEAHAKGTAQSFDVKALNLEGKTPEQVALIRAALIVAHIDGRFDRAAAMLENKVSNVELEQIRLLVDVKFTEGRTPTLVALEGDLEIALVREILKRQGIEVLEINGSTKDVDSVVKSFNEKVDENTKLAQDEMKDYVLLTNQMGLTGFDYQMVANFLLFDSRLPETQVMQSIGRVGRTIKGGGGSRFESHAVVYLDRPYIENQFASLKENPERLTKWKEYFQKRINHPQTKSGLVYWVREVAGRMEISPVERTGAGWHQRTVVDLLDAVARGETLTAKEELLLSTAINSAEAISETAKSLLEQLWTFRLIIDPVKEAYRKALELGNENDKRLVREFGEHLHRHWKGGIGMELAEQFFNGEALVRGVTNERVERAKTEMDAFLKDQGAKLSPQVRAIIEKASKVAETVKEELNKYETIDPDSPEFKNTFQGNLPETPLARSRAMIAIAKRFAIDILPTETTRTPEKSGLELAQSRLEVTVRGAVKDELVSNPANDVLTDHLVKPGDRGNIDVNWRAQPDGSQVPYAKFFGKEIDLSALGEANQSLLFTFPYLSIAVNQDGSFTLAPNLEKLLSQHAGELAITDLPPALAAIFSNASELAQALLIQGMLDRTGLEASDRRAILRVIGSQWTKLRDELEKVGSDEQRFRILREWIPGLSVIGASRIASELGADAHLLRNLAAYNKVHTGIRRALKDVTKIDPENLMDLNLWNLWIGLKAMSLNPSELEQANQQVEMIIATALLASSELGSSSQQKALEAFGLQDAAIAQLTQPVEGLMGEWENPLEIIAMRGLAVGALDAATISNEMRAIRRLTEKAQSSQVALGDLVKLLVYEKRSAQEVNAILNLHTAVKGLSLQSGSHLYVDSLFDTVILFDVGVHGNVAELTTLQKLLTALESVGDSVATLHDFVMYLNVLGLFDAEFVKESQQYFDFTYTAEIESRKAELKAKMVVKVEGQNEVMIQGLSGKDRLILDLDTVTNQMVTNAGLKFVNGTWVVELTDGDWGTHVLRLTPERIEQIVRYNDKELKLARIDGRRQVTFDEIHGPLGKAAELQLSRPDKPFRTRVRFENGHLIVDYGADFSELDTGRVQAIFDENASLFTSIDQNILGLSNLNAGSALRLNLIPGEKGLIPNVDGTPVQYKTTVNGKEVTRDVVLPPNARLSVTEDGQLRIVLESVIDGNHREVGWFEVDPLQNLVTTVQGIDLNALLDFAYFEPDQENMTVEVRNEIISKRSTAFKQRIAQEIYLALDEAGRQAFVAWHNPRAAILSEAVLLNEIESQFLTGLADQTQASALKALIRSLKMFFASQEPVQALIRKLGRRQDQTEKVLRKALMDPQPDSPETQAIIGLFSSLAEASGEFEDMEAMIQDSPAALLRRIFAKHTTLKDEFLNLLSSQGNLTYDELIKFLEEKLKGDTPQELEILKQIARFAQFMANEDHQEKVIEALLEDVPVENRETERLRLEAVIRFLAMRTGEWDLFYYKRMAYWAEHNEISRLLKEAREELDRQKATGLYRQAARLIVQELAEISDASRGITQDKAEQVRFAEDLAKMLQAGDDHSSPDFVEFNFDHGSKIANLPVVKERIARLVETGLSVEEATYQANAEWRSENGYRDHPVPSMIFRGDAAKKLGVYWKFIEKDWGSRSGAETFTGREFGREKAVDNLLARTGLLVMDARWKDQSYFHEELHLIYPRPYFYDPFMSGDGSDYRVEEVMNFFAQMLSRSIDLETGRTYDLQMLYSKMENYAREYHTDLDIMRGAMSAFLHLVQFMPMPLALNILRNTEQVEDLIFWLQKSPDDLEQMVKNIKGEAIELEKSGMAAVIQAPDDTKRKAIAKQMAQTIHDTWAADPRQAQALANRLMRQAYTAYHDGRLRDSAWHAFAQTFLDEIATLATSEQELVMIQQFLTRLEKFLNEELPKQRMNEQQLEQLKRIRQTMPQTNPRIDRLIDTDEQHGEMGARALQTLFQKAPKNKLVMDFIIKHLAMKNADGVAEIDYADLMENPERLNRKYGVYFAKLSGVPVNLGDLLKHAQLPYEISFFRLGDQWYASTGARATGTEVLGKKQDKVFHNHPPHHDGTYQILPSLTDENADALFQSDDLAILTGYGVTAYRLLTKAEQAELQKAGVKVGVRIKVGDADWTTLDWDAEIGLESNWAAISQKVAEHAKKGEHLLLDFIHPSKDNVKARVEFLPWQVVADTASGDRQALFENNTLLKHIQSNLTESDESKLQETLTKIAASGTKEGLSVEAIESEIAPAEVVAGEEFTDLALWQNAPEAVPAPAQEAAEKPELPEPPIVKTRKEAIDEFLGNREDAKQISENEEGHSELRGVFGINEWKAMGRTFEQGLSAIRQINQSVGWPVDYMAYILQSIVSGELSEEDFLFALDRQNHVVGYLILMSDSFIYLSAVRPNEQGKGIGKELFQAAVNLTRKRGFNHLTLEYRGNQPQAAFYEAMSRYYPVIQKIDMGQPYPNGDPRIQIIYDVHENRAELRLVKAMPTPLYRLLHETQGLETINPAERLVYQQGLMNAYESLQKAAEDEEFRSIYFGTEVFNERYLSGIDIDLHEAFFRHSKANGAFNRKTRRMALATTLIKRAATDPEAARFLEAVILHELVHAYLAQNEAFNAFTRENPVAALYREELLSHALMARILGTEIINEKLLQEIADHVAQQVEEAIQDRPDLAAQTIDQLRQMLNKTADGKPVFAVIGIGHMDRAALVKLNVKTAPELISQANTLEEARTKAQNLRKQGYEVVLVSDARDKQAAEIQDLGEFINIVRSETGYEYLLAPLINTAGFLGYEGFMRAFGLKSGVVELNHDFAARIENLFQNFQAAVTMQVAA
ncbi:MAG: hypothetical protein COW12_00180, partial [Candidatus Omnitrophica bacterium CG12_big_fil_rev_8_21_14_0_65_45_16]